MLMRIPDGHKTCQSCYEIKPFTEYRKNKRMKDGLHTLCKPCHSARSRDYYLRNLEKYREHNAAYREAHLEEMAAYNLEWNRRNKDKRREYHSRRRSRRLAAEVHQHVTLDWLWQRDGSDCFYCGVALSRTWGAPNSAELEHMTPLHRGGGHTEDNCVLACRTCNRRKGTMTAEEFATCLSATKLPG